MARRGEASAETLPGPGCVGQYRVQRQAGSVSDNVPRVQPRAHVGVESAEVRVLVVFRAETLVALRPCGEWSRYPRVPPANTHAKDIR